MKTPDEIKKGLFVCSDLEGNCPYCPYAINGHRDPEGMCIKELANDALAYIQQLETERHQLLTRCERLERERDAAVADIPRACGYCKWFEINLGGNMTECHNPNGCMNISGINTGFEWRGVKEE